MGWDSAVGIATFYGLDFPGIESQWGQDFPHLSRPALGPTQPPIQLVKQPPYSAEVKGRTELCLYSPCGPSWPILGRTLPLPFTEVCLQKPALWHIYHKNIFLYLTRLAAIRKVKTQHIYSVFNDNVRSAGYAAMHNKICD
jgi:hypothetical protein